MKPLDAKELSRGMRVIKIRGEREGAIGTVRGVDWRNNLIGVEFEGDGRVTLECIPAEFRLYTPPRSYLTGKPPPGTVTRGSLE